MTRCGKRSGSWTRVASQAPGSPSTTSTGMAGTAASPNPILLGADLINESDRLRVGQCGTILPDWNPIRVAEDIALLDQLTRGRVDFGVARGINNRATIQFREEADRRNEQHRSLFNETLEVILGAWRNDAFSYKGEFFTYPAPGWQETNPLGRDSRFHS